MKRVINGKIRDTDKMTLIISDDNGLLVSDLYYADYSIYRDVDGALILVEGCVRWTGNTGGYREEMEQTTKAEALERLEEWQTEPNEAVKTL